MASELKILITTGDPDGIGWEVTSKALHSIGPQKGVQFFFYRHEQATKVRPALSKKFRHKIVSTLTQANELSFDSNVAVEIRSSLPAAIWVEEAVKACHQKQFSALVTAPLSKTSIIDSGLRDIGHTEILARISGEKNLFMGFVGAKFCVVLMTAHEPLQRAVKSFSKDKLIHAARAAHEMLPLVSKSKRGLPMAVVGLNPHAGEQGLLGGEERWMADALTELKSELGAIEGPLVPDAAFLPQNWSKFSVYLCPYHDQGLIPFKLVHGFKSGVHLTLGLPFVRTSVDHGTAKELFGKNKAEAGSMKDAIMSAVRLCKEAKS